jgi:bifunctional non-homologous end joining protein LigD
VRPGGADSPGAARARRACLLRENLRQEGSIVYVPLNRKEATFDGIKSFTHAVAEALQKERPNLVTARMARDNRAGRVFINWSQNGASMTMVCVYSLRAEEQPTVSFPLSWGEVEAAVRRGAAGKLRITAAEALSRIAKRGDSSGRCSSRSKLPREGPVPERQKPLQAYAAKRRFEKTPEPPPGRRVSREKHRVFVVQKHQARALHYDLRLELDGVLKSWAVPKGPSLDPSVKRLAVMVEDHPLDYQNFEGNIPKGSYGAGSVIVWDKGLYHHPPSRRVRQRNADGGPEQGDLKFVLHGKKLRGELRCENRRTKSPAPDQEKDRHATRRTSCAESIRPPAGCWAVAASPAGRPLAGGSRRCGWRR